MSSTKMRQHPSMISDVWGGVGGPESVGSAASFFNFVMPDSALEGAMLPKGVEGVHPKTRDEMTFFDNVFEKLCLDVVFGSFGV